MFAERNRLAEEMAHMVEPIVEMAHLGSRIDLCDRQIRSLNFSHVRPVLEGASPVIATLFGEVFVLDAFHAVARLHPDSEKGIAMILSGLRLGG